MKGLRASTNPDQVGFRSNTTGTELAWKRGGVNLRSADEAGTALDSLHAKATVITIPNAAGSRFGK